MANTIRIPRSVSTNTPAALDQGELAFSESGSPNGIGELFIGVAGPGVQKIATLTGAAAAEPNDTAQDNQTITTGLGIDGADAGDAGNITITLGTAELTVAAMAAGDWIVFNDLTDGLPKRALLSGINLSLFNDDLGHVENATHTGEVTGATVLSLDVTAITNQPAHGVIIAADTILSNDGGVLSEATFTQMITFFDANLAFGQVDSVGAGVGLIGSGTAADPILTLDFSELTDMTGGISGTTEFILQDGVTESRKAASEIQLQNFDNSVSEFVSENDTIVVVDWNWVLDEDLMGSDSAVHVPTQQSVKAYVDSVASGGMTHKGGYNASTNTPALDTGSPVLAVGDLYTVTVAGTFFTIPLEVGDTLISDVDSSDAANVNDWTIVQTNLGAASETTPGYIQLATQAEMDTGTDDAKAVTPLKYANSIIDGGTF